MLITIFLTAFIIGMIVLIVKAVIGLVRWILRSIPKIAKVGYHAGAITLQVVCAIIGVILAQVLLIVGIVILIIII